MKRYEAYKSCNIPWIKQIPDHWISQRGKNLYKKEQRAVKDTDEVVTCFRDGRVTLRKNRRTTGFTEALNEFGYQGIRKGDLVIHVMDAFAGAIGVSDSDGKGTPVYNVCTPKGDSNNYYYAYALREMARAGFIQSLYRGIRERSSEFRFDVFARQYLPVPPRDEQDQIVRYLDWQVSKINRLIATKRKQIELLKEHKEAFINTAVTRGIVGDIPLKESGMQWLPKIPAHWKPVPAKALFRNISELRHEDDPMLAATQKYGLIEQAEYMRRENRRIVLANDNLDKWLHVEPNDFIISLRSFQGGLEKCDKPGCVTWHYVVLRPQQHVYPPFYKWFFKSASYIGALQKTSDFIRDGQDLRFSNFVKVGLFVIPMAEQVKIADRLDSEIPKYQKAIDTLEKEIQQIIEYRTRLISDVVTGQIDVRGVGVPDFIYAEDTDSKQMDEAEEYMGVR